MQWICIIGETDKRNNRGEDIVFKHQYLEVKGCQRYFVAASSVGYWVAGASTVQAIQMRNRLITLQVPGRYPGVAAIT
ncbi:MAG: hypothetical protein WAT12_07460 [Candidatus Nitrotoga sp.]